MQRWKKHLWTGSLLTLSVLLILAAVAMGVVRLLDIAAPKYREKLSEELSVALELPVTIGSIGMRWQMFRPTLELDDVIILDAERRPVLQVGHIGLPFKWGSLFSGELFPYLIEFNRFALVLEWRPDGSVGISGVDAGAESGQLDLGEVLGYLDKINRIEVRDGVINWNDFGAQIGLTRIEQVNATLSKSDVGLDVLIDGRFPRHLGERFIIEAKLEGDLSEPAQMKAVTQFRTDALYADGWLAPVLAETAALRGGPVKVQFASHWKGLEFKNAALRVTADPLQNVGAEEKVELPGLNAELKISPLGEGWEMDIVSLQYWYEAGKGPVSRGNFRYRPTDDGFGTQLDAELDTLRVADLMAWLSVLQVTEDVILPVGPEVKGQLLNTRFEFQQAVGSAPEFVLGSLISELGTPALGPLPGLQGFSGRLLATQAAGRLDLSSEKGLLSIPLVFAEAIPLKKFKTQLHWEKQGTGWRLFSDGLDLTTRSLIADGSFSLLLDDAPTPYIDLALDFKADDIVPLKSLIPLPPALSEGVGSWLQDSLVAGSVPSGKFELKGRLADFPFENADEPGLFKIAFKSQGTKLNYATGWPPIEKINGSAVFQGRSMRVVANSAEILGVPVSRTVAEIPDFKKSVLEVNGQVQADVGRQLAFLAATPMKEEYAPLLDALVVQGPGQLKLNLKLPLGDLEATSVSGDIDLQGCELKYAGLDVPVKDIRGGFHFSERGLSAESLQGQFLGLPLQASLMPSKTSGAGITELHAIAVVNLPDDATKLASYMPSSILPALAGQTEVHLRTSFDSAASAGELVVSSDLRGLQVNLGEPFRKSAEALKDLRVTLMPKASQTEVQLQYGNSVHSQLRFVTGESATVLEKGQLHFGQKSDLTWPEQAVMRIDGKLPMLDLTGVGVPSGGSSAPMPPIMVDVEFDELRAAGQSFRKIRLKSESDKPGVLTASKGTISIQSERTSGNLGWEKADAGRLRINGNFDRLNLIVPPDMPVSVDETSGEPAESATPIDPATLPLLNLTASNFRLGNEGLGALKLDTQAIETGIRIALLEIGGRRIEVRGGGEWTRHEGKSSARLVMNINGNDIVGLLNATGYAPSITAEQADIFAELDWAAAESGLDMKNLNGKMSFDLIDGSLLEVQPGAGRVLSLLSFYSLPRRLTLDFSDVLGKGTAFDKLTGDFAIKDGNATTDNLEVNMPSAHIEVRGRIGLAQRDYDQVVTIYPGISSGVAIAGAVLGGPVLGIGLWIAQEFLNKPFDQVAQISYRLSGSWDDPEVEGVDAPPKSRRKNTPGGVPQVNKPGVGPRNNSNILKDAPASGAAP